MRCCRSVAAAAAVAGAAAERRHFLLHVILLQPLLLLLLLLCLLLQLKQHLVWAEVRGLAGALLQQISKRPETLDFLDPRQVGTSSVSQGQNTKPLNPNACII